MPPPIVIQAGDDSSVLLPVENVAGYTALAVARAWPEGPALQTWRTQDHTAVITSDGVHLVTDGAEHWTWRSAEVDLLLTAPDRSTTVAGPWRIRVRPLYSHA